MTRAKQPTRQTMRQRMESADTGTDTVSRSTQPSQPDRRSAPGGYGDEVLWNMACRFEEMAAENGVYLGRGAPWIYKALEPVMAKTRIRERKFYNSHGVRVTPANVGRAVVWYFWTKHRRNESGDVLAEFCDVVLMKDLLQEVDERWLNRRLAVYKYDKKEG